MMRALVASVALLGTSFGGGYVQTGDVPDNAVRSSGVSQMVDRGPVGQFKALENDSQMTGIPAYLPWYCLFFRDSLLAKPRCPESKTKIRHAEPGSHEHLMWSDSFVVSIYR